MQNSYVVEHTCLYDSYTHNTQNKTLAWTHTRARALDSLAGRPPEPHLYSAPCPSRRMKRERARIKECFRNSNLPFHSNARSAAASALRTIAQLMVRVSPTVYYLYVAVLAATASRKTHKPFLLLRYARVRSPQIFQVRKECLKTGRFSRVTLRKETKHNLLECQRTRKQMPEQNNTQNLSLSAEESRENASG